MFRSLIVLEKKGFAAIAARKAAANQKLVDALGKSPVSTSTVWEEFFSLHSKNGVLPATISVNEKFQSLLGVSSETELSTVDAMTSITEVLIARGKINKKATSSSTGVSTSKFPALALNPETREVLGLGEAATRPEVTKALWVYIKEQKLQNPNNGKEFTVDAALARVLKTEPDVQTLNLFSVHSYLYNAFDPAVIAQRRAEKEAAKELKKTKTTEN